MLDQARDNRFFVEDALLRAEAYRSQRERLETIQPRTEAIAEHIGQLAIDESHWRTQAETASNG